MYKNFWRLDLQIKQVYKYKSIHKLVKLNNFDLLNKLILFIHKEYLLQYSKELDHGYME
jgi:hypothetical protein